MVAHWKWGCFTEMNTSFYYSKLYIPSIAFGRHFELVRTPVCQKIISLSLNFMSDNNENEWGRTLIMTAFTIYLPNDTAFRSDFLLFSFICSFIQLFIHSFNGAAGCCQGLRSDFLFNTIVTLWTCYISNLTTSRTFVPLSREKKMKKYVTAIQHKLNIVD